MDEVIDLQATLGRLNAEALACFDPGSADGMRKLAEDLGRRRALRKERSPSPTLVERQETAVRRLLKGDRASDFRTLRYACLGSTRYIAEDHRVLLADRHALDALLAAVEPYAGQPRRFRRLYDWLLRAYLVADRQAEWFASAAAQGNERLRAFLKATFNSVCNSEPAPEWVGTLASYPEILSSDPGRRFAQGVLAGDPRELDEACRSLRLTGTSWLAMEAVRSATDAAVAGDDPAFRARIPTLLKVAGEPRFAPLRDEVYAAMVTHYAEMTDRPVHTDLRDQLVAAWKNPWLSQNDKTWGSVSPEARKMVAGWLKQEFIKQFFEVLSDDRGQDRSRFEFWSQFHERMDDVYIALGSAAYHSSKPDLVKLRKVLDGRLLKLRSTNPRINAFIMFMGNVVVVEFSQYGNAAYRYRRADAPIDGTTGQIPIEQLRKAPPGIRMIHSEARRLTWQQRFAQELGLGLKTTQRATTQPVSRIATQSNLGAQTQTWRQPASHRLTSSVPPPAAVIALAHKHSLNWADQRSRGGNLWVLAQNDGSEVAQQLKAWGFAYKQGKGWWKE